MPLFMFYVWEQDYFGTTHLLNATTSHGPKATLSFICEKKSIYQWDARNNDDWLRINIIYAIEF